MTAQVPNPADRGGPGRGVGFHAFLDASKIMATAGNGGTIADPGCVADLAGYTVDFNLGNALDIANDRFVAPYSANYLLGFATGVAWSTKWRMGIGLMRGGAYTELVTLTNSGNSPNGARPAYSTAIRTLLKAGDVIYLGASAEAGGSGRADYGTTSGYPGGTTRIFGSYLG